MIKSDILKLIEYRKKLLESNYGNETYVRTKDLLELKIPNITEIQEYLNTLNQELTALKSKKRAALNYIKTNKEKVTKINCTHPLIFSSQCHGWGCCVSASCVLCKKTLEEAEKITEKVEILEDYSDEDSYERNYNFNDLYPLLIEILKKYKDTDEVNLNKEFLKLYHKGIIGEVTINGQTYQKKYNILLIGGSNEIKLDKNIFINHHGYNNTLKIIEYLEYIKRKNLDLIISHDMEYKRLSRFTKHYQTLDEFLSLLNEKQENKYDLIINITNLFDYKIENEQIVIKTPEINLQELFPNTPIINLNDNEEINLTEILDKYSETSALTKDFKKLLLKR